MSSSFQPMSPEDLQEIQTLPGNDVCIDCKTRSPEWASVKFVTLFCLECSGIHRSLGTHIDFVRSLMMDSWSDEQLQLIKSGGNQAFRDFFTKHGAVYNTATTTSNDPNIRKRITQACSCPAAVLYKQVLQARLHGRPEPTKLPPPSKTPPHNQGKSATKKRMEGFGSPPPPERPPRFGRRVVTLSATTTIVVGGAAWYLLSSHHSAHTLSTTALSTKQIQAFYNRIGGLLDVMSLVEDEPRQYALAQAQLGPTNHVLEIGMGTGRTAQYMQETYGPLQSYIGMDVSTRMVQLGSERLRSFGDGVRVLQGNVLSGINFQAQGWTYIDTILAFYVLDIWTPSDIRSFLQQSRHLLLLSSTSAIQNEEQQDPKIVLVSLSHPRGDSFLSRIVMGLWSRLYHASPILVGGCRPIDLTEFLSNVEWGVVEERVFSVLGYTSQVVLARPIR